MPPTKENEVTADWRENMEANMKAVLMLLRGNGQLGLVIRVDRLEQNREVENRDQKRGARWRWLIAAMVTNVITGVTVGYIVARAVG